MDTEGKTTENGCNGARFGVTVFSRATVKCLSKKVVFMMTSVIVAMHKLISCVSSADSLDSFKRNLNFIFLTRVLMWKCLCTCTPVMPYRPGFSL